MVFKTKVGLFSLSLFLVIFLISSPLFAWTSKKSVKIKSGQEYTLKKSLSSAYGSDSWYGIYGININNSSIWISPDSMIKTCYKNSGGIYIEDSSDIFIGNQGYITAKKKNSNGIFVKNSSNLEILNVGVIYAHEKNSNCIKVEDSTNITIRNREYLQAYDSHTNAISVSNSSNVHIENDIGGKIYACYRGISVENCLNAKIILNEFSSVRGGCPIFMSGKNLSLDILGIIDGGRTAVAVKGENVDIKIGSKAQIKGDILLLGGEASISFGNDGKGVFSFDDDIWGYEDLSNNNFQNKEEKDLAFKGTCVSGTTHLNGKKNWFSTMTVNRCSTLGGKGKIRTNGFDGEGIIVEGTLENSLDLEEAKVTIKNEGTLSIVNDKSVNLSKGNITLEKGSNLNYEGKEGLPIDADKLNGFKLVEENNDDVDLKDINIQINGVNTSATLKFNAKIDGKDVIMEVERIKYNSFAIEGLTEYIASFLDTDTTSSKYNFLYNRLRTELDKIATEDEEKVALGMITPLSSLSGTYAAAESAGIFSDKLLAHKNIRSSNEQDSFFIWATPYVFMGKQKPVENFSGYDWNTNGGLAGIEKKYGSFNIGFGLGTSDTTTNKSDLFKANINSLNLGSYAQWNVSDKFFIQGVLGYTSNNTDSEKKLSLNSDYPIMGDMNTEIFSTYVFAGVKYNPASQFYITPKIGVKNILVKQGEFIERIKGTSIPIPGSYGHGSSDSNSVLSRISSVDWNELSGEVGLDLVFCISEKANIHSSLSFVRIIDSDEKKAYYEIGDSGKQEIELNNVSDNSLNFNLGCNLMVSDNLELHLNSKLNVNEDVKSIGMTAGASYSF